MVSQPEFFPKPPGCQHANTSITFTPELSHHAREDCADCGKFLRWVPKPETVQRDSENVRKITALRSVANLPKWEAAFLLSLEKQGRHFSPKQQVRLDEIYDTFFGTQDR
jgi:hypothetical protein